MHYFLLAAFLLSQVVFSQTALAQAIPTERYRILTNEGTALLLDTKRGYVWQQTLCPEEKVLDQLDNCWMKMTFINGTPQEVEEALNKLVVKAKPMVAPKKPMQRRR
jgi:hypothetical protein